MDPKIPTTTTSAPPIDIKAIEPLKSARIEDIHLSDTEDEEEEQFFPILSSSFESESGEEQPLPFPSPPKSTPTRKRKRQSCSRVAQSSKKKKSHKVASPILFPLGNQSEAGEINRKKGEPAALSSRQKPIRLPADSVKIGKDLLDKADEFAAINKRKQEDRAVKESETTSSNDPDPTVRKNKKQKAQSY